MGLPDISLQHQQRQRPRSEPVHEPGEPAESHVAHEIPACHPAETLDADAVYGNAGKSAQQPNFVVELADLADDNALEKQSQPPPLRRPRSSFGDQQALYVGSHDFRGDFVRKVYMLLSMQMALTVGVMCFCMFYTPMRAAIVHNLRASLWSTFAVMLVLLLALMFFRDRHPVNYGLFLAFTVAVSFHIGIVGAICAEAGMAMTVLNAGVVTLGVFASLTVYAMYSKQDFSWMQAYLFTGLNCMILWGLFALIIGWQTSLLYSLCGCVLFCGFIVYDTQRITTIYGYDDYLLAAIDLYLDIVNLFLYILSLMSRSRND